MVELQAHSTVSDGELEPAAVVEAAAAAGVKTLALTDHDAVDGVPAAATASAAAGLELIPATELSAAHETAEELHILGYWIDLDAIAGVCERAQRERVARARNRGAAERRRCRGHARGGDRGGRRRELGRPSSHRARRRRDRDEEFFKRYLIPGAETYVPRRWPTAAEAVGLIHDAGGAALLAHPFWDLDDPAEVTALIDELAIDGVECFYPTHTCDQVEHLLGLCRERGLTPTGSSDFHGPSHKLFRRFGAYDTFGLGRPEIPSRPPK